MPYHESDHVLNIAYNALLGGIRLEDIELRRKDEVFLNALGAQRIADVISAEESRSLSIHKENFLRFIGHDFFVGLQFERISSERLKHPIFPVQERLFESVSAH